MPTVTAAELQKQFKLPIELSSLIEGRSSSRANMANYSPQTDFMPTSGQLPKPPAIGNSMLDREQLYRSVAMNHH